VSRLTYSAFDPRSAIRSQIGYERYMNDDDRSTVSVTDDWDDTVYLPLYLPGEVRTGNMPEMPFIEMTLITSPSKPMNIGADIRDQDCYMDFHIYYTNTDHITPTTFGKTIADEIVDKITANRCSVTGVAFMEVINDSREFLEEYENGKSVIFHRIVEVHCKNYD